MTPFSEDDVVEMLRHYFSALPIIHRNIVKRHFLEILSLICLDVSQSNVQLISSSILLVYDLSEPTRLACKMIDFAHSHVHEHKHSDENYLEGIENLIRFIEKIT